jgi:HEAT repeat protein
MIDPAPPEVVKIGVPMMLKALGHANPRVRAEAARALGKVVGVSAEAAAALNKARKDADATVREAVEEALKRAKNGGRG